MFLKKEVILLGVLLSLRIIFTMDISEVFTYPILILIIYIAIKYNTKE